MKANLEARRTHYMWCLRFYTEAIYQEYPDGGLKQTTQISSHFALLVWVCVCVSGFFSFLSFLILLLFFVYFFLQIFNKKEVLAVNLFGGWRGPPKHEFIEDDRMYL